MNKHSYHHHDGFWSGFILGTIFGGLVFFVLSTEEGQKGAKKLLKKGGDLLEELEEKVPELREYWEEKKEEKAQKENSSLVGRINKRFFTKEGKKLGA